MVKKKMQEPVEIFLSAPPGLLYITLPMCIVAAAGLEAC